MGDTQTPLLEVAALEKQFPGVRALHDVDLTLNRGEVLAVVGENGAGKSTLMKILAGVHTPNAGTIRIDGTEVRVQSVRDAQAHGIALIHQELNLADNLTVGANIFLGREPLRRGLIDERAINARSREYLEMVGLDVDPRQTVDQLTIGRQQMVEIAKALSIDARILIMDEPTSSLSTEEAERLFEVILELKSRGVSVIYISHRLREVRRLADRVTVLRDGENAGELVKEEIDHDAMVRLMVGRDISQFYARERHEVGEVVLEVGALQTPAWPKHALSFSICAGEIVGLAGLVGAGRTELLRTLFGVDRRVSGEIRLNGISITNLTPAAMIRSGLALVPEDRKLHGIVLEMSLRNNVGLAGLRRNCLAAGFLNQKKENLDTDQMIQQLGIKTPSPHQITQYLSGGNQQKAVIAKWLTLSPNLLLLDEPTRGIDVGAKEEIYRLMEALAGEGKAILFASSEMEEILGMSDRVLVMHEGKIAGELSREELSEEAIMQLATGAGQTVSAE
ncbi:MAG TPA: sugar ABC transporter ATP-binding protein [Planctomycetaceae bacterium]|nr:sugar ABC transporter ATP-binding protein [Planctomycetaceae bacterium]